VIVHGREIDLFRIGLFGGALRRRAAALAEIKRNSYLTLVPPLESVGARISHASTRPAWSGSRSTRMPPGPTS